MKEVQELVIEVRRLVAALTVNAVYAGHWPRCQRCNALAHGMTFARTQLWCRPCALVENVPLDVSRACIPRWLEAALERSLVVLEIKP